MADTTGMGQAQNTDKGAAKVGRARQAWRRGTTAVSDFLPGTFFRPEKKARIDAQGAKMNERARLEAQAEHEAAKQAQAAPDAKTVTGDDLPVFTRSLLDAIRRGQSRADENTPEMLIRSVVCDEKFINTILQGSIKTPLEEADTEYAKQMVGRRRNLASHLDMSRKHSDYNIGMLTSHEMDIIYTTMLGDVKMWAQAQWPENKPKPPEAFFRFLESVAIKERPGSEGRFIGSALKALASSRTVTGSSDQKTFKTLIDAAYVNQYLYQKSAEPIDRAVGDFKELVTSVLDTPTGTLHSELGVPGIGYVKAYNDKRSQLVSESESAKADYDKVTKDERELEVKLRRVKAIKKEKEDGVENENTKKYSLEQLEAAVAKTQKALDDEKANNADMKEQLRLIVLARVAEVRKFESEHGPTVVTQQLVDHFRAMIVGGVNAQLDGIGESMKGRLPNLAVTDLLGRAQKLADEREEFAPILVGTQLVDASDPEAKGKKTTDIARDMIGYKIPDFEAKITQFERDIEDADLPEKTKEPIRGIAKGLKHFGVQRDFIMKQLGDIKEAHAFPLKKAAQLSVEKLAKREFSNLVGITDEQRLIARMEWESTSSDIESPPGARESKWQRIKQWVGWNLFTWEGFLPKRMVLGTIQWTFRNDIDDLRPKNFMQKVVGKRPDGTVYKSKYFRRGMVGTTSLLLKSYVIGGLLTGLVLSSTEQTWYKPWSWPAPIVRRAGGPFMVEASHWYEPWTWVMPVRNDRNTVMVYHDHYDIPERLADRGADFYRSSYGVGNSFDGQTYTPQQRLDWLQSHPEVLRFFQERASGHIVTGWEQLRHNDTNPEQCTTSQRAIPQTCDDLLGPDVLARERVSEGGSRNHDRFMRDALTNYTPRDNPNIEWRQGMRVCCEIRISRAPVPDGLMLNRSTSDRFVDELMRNEERGHVRVTYEYLASPGTRINWVNSWYLVTPTEHDIMEQYRIRDRPNVQFIMTQGSVVSNKLLPRCGEIGEAKENIPQEHRDEFVRLWREAVSAASSGHDPSQEDIADETINTTFETARTQAIERRWIVDTSTQYDRRQIKDVELGLLHIQTETAVDTLLVDYRNRNQAGQSVENNLYLFLHQFASTSSSWQVYDNRADDFVQVLDMHRRRGGSLSEFDPFSSTQGSRVQWAVGMQLIRRAADFQASAPTADGGTAAPAPADSGTQVRAAPPVPDLSPAAERFYSNPTNQGFVQVIDNMLQTLFQDQGHDGDTMRRTLSSARFGGNRDRMTRALKAEVYRLVSSTADADRRTVDGYHLHVTGSGDTLHVDDIQPGHIRNFSRSFRQWIIERAREQAVAGAPPR